MRLLMISNRLPITVSERGGQLRFQQSVGGLVSGISAYLDSLRSSSEDSADYVWIGWPGISVAESEKNSLREKAFKEYKAHPVFLSEKVMDKFYHGFCNKTIWPLFHYFPSYTVYEEEYWSHYKKVNALFCEAVLEVARPEDVIWVHDYHLMLLPKLLRAQRPEMSVGFFLHIPFPTFEVFRLLPMRWRAEILEGLLGADLIGFHTHDYTQYFLTSVLRLLGHEHRMGELLLDGRTVRAESYPMGIHYEKFHQAVLNPRGEEKKLEQILSPFKVILSVDRLDYSKGIANRLQGFEIFLEKNPQWRGKVVLLLVVVPSRVLVEQYQQMKKQIDELVGRINGKWGSIGWTPILYQCRFVPFYSLVEMYRNSDVALITPLRDGMNLIAKEYLASKGNSTGVLILSEMAGAAKELGEAILINPNNREEIAEAIQGALTMPPEEQIRRNQIMQDRLRRYDVVRWAKHFLEDLERVKKRPQRFKMRWLGSKERGDLTQHFQTARERLILLDYDGTLVPFALEPKMAQPLPSLITLLSKLVSFSGCEVVLISGRTREVLEGWFGSLPVHLVAEHGVWIKEKGCSWQLSKPLTNSWKPKLLPILESYSERLPGSFVEEKEYALAWHYRKSDSELGESRAKELMDDLMSYTANIDVHVFQGNKVVEVKNTGVHKGTAASHFLSRLPADFLLAVGDDTTDEDLFRVLPPQAHTLRVGVSESAAQFHLQNHTEVLRLLEEML